MTDIQNIADMMDDGEDEFENVDPYDYAIQQFNTSLIRIANRLKGKHPGDFEGVDLYGDDVFDLFDGEEFNDM